MTPARHLRKRSFYGIQQIRAYRPQAVMIGTLLVDSDRFGFAQSITQVAMQPGLQFGRKVFETPQGSP